MIAFYYCYVYKVMSMFYLFYTNDLVSKFNQTFRNLRGVHSLGSLICHMKHTPVGYPGVQSSVFFSYFLRVISNRFHPDRCHEH